MDQSSIYESKSPPESPESPGQNGSEKLVFSPNFEPAAPPQRKFVYFPSKRIDWFKFVGELEGCASTTAELAEMLEDVSVGPLSIPRNKQFSIFEAQPARFNKTESYDFPECEPSDYSKGVHSCICEKNKFDAWPMIILFAAFMAIKICVFGSSFSSTIGTKLNLSLFALVPFVEVIVWLNWLNIYRERYRNFENYCIKELLYKSCQLAVALPRLLISECGPSKFLKQQIKRPRMMIGVTLFLSALTMAISCFVLSAYSKNVFQIIPNLPYLQIRQAYLIFLGISCITSALTFLGTLYCSYMCHMSLNLMKTSICCNLRGFLLTQNYALDYSEMHMLDEGLSYMFGNESPTIYVPYLSIREAFIHVEPYSVRFQYKFTKKELQYLDAKNCERAQSVLRRGFDYSVMTDVLVWAVFVLENQLKVWIPLSLTQLQSSNVIDSVMFGFCGHEVSEICKMTAQQLKEEDEENCSVSQLEKVRAFCESYQKMRSSSIAEEALHLSCLDKVFTPGCEEQM